MDFRKLKNIPIVALIALFALPVQAQETLLLNTPVTARVPPNGSSSWTFTAQSGAILSFALHAQTEDFDPALTLTDSSGRVVVSDDDYNYPASTDPLLEAITMPRTDTYRLTVTGINRTFGEYTLTMLPGYSVLGYTDDFSDSTWQPTGAALVTITDEQLLASTEGAGVFGVAFSEDAGSYVDFYAQADVVSVRNSAGWLVGMAFRQRGDDYYLLAINSDGNWRFSAVEGGDERLIRDWTPHPNIIPGATSFSIGVLAKDVGFDFFYNTGYIGSASDTAIDQPGQIGLMVGTMPSLTANNATFDNLIVTSPLLIDGEGIIPQQVLSGDGRGMVNALKRQHVISADGALSLTLEESSVQYARPGINRVMLGRGTRYTNFAIGTTVTLDAASVGPAGCGIVFRFASETDYTLAYINQDGEYGVSARRGDAFEPGLYGVEPTLGEGQHHLLIIADDETLYYYIDRQFVGSLENTPQNGEVGIAVVNFESNTTACNYSNFWLWDWE